MAKLSDRKSWIGTFAVLGLYLIVFIVARIALEREDLSQSLKVFLALLPVLPFTWMLWRFIKGIVSLDELQKKIQLEALAIAYPVMMVFLMTIGLLDRAVGLSAENFGASHLWYYMPVFYFGGLFIAQRRYQ
jgi:hypothetical protein